MNGWALALLCLAGGEVAAPDAGQPSRLLYQSGVVLFQEQTGLVFALADTKERAAVWLYRGQPQVLFSLSPKAGAKGGDDDDEEDPKLQVRGLSGKRVPKRVPKGDACQPGEGPDEQLLVLGADAAAIKPVRIRCEKKPADPARVLGSPAVSAWAARCGGKGAAAPVVERQQRVDLTGDGVEETVWVVRVQPAPDPDGMERRSCLTSVAQVGDALVDLSVGRDEAGEPELETLLKQAFTLEPKGAPYVELDTGSAGARSGRVVRWDGSAFQVVLRGTPGNG